MTTAPAADGRFACLMYHRVPGEPADATGWFDVPRERFVEQLDGMLREPTPVRALETVADGAPGVAMTFDDGDLTQYEVACPALAERGAAGTFFVITSRVGTAGYASWAQLREMQRAGMSIQSHTHTHPFLSTLPRARAEDELRRSRDAIEQALGTPVVTIALPNGDAPRGFRPEDYAALGYRWVATSVWGPSVRTRARVRRYTVRRGTPLERVLRMARGEVPALSSEGVRLRVLSGVRGAIGPTRYARWRSALLELAR